MMTKQLKVQFTFRKKPHDQPVHYKLDGGRFDVERTLKFNVKSKYNVEVTLRPALSLQSVIIMGQAATLLVKTLENDFVVYKAEWLTTGIEKCKKGDRQQVPVTLQIKNAGELKVTWQCKFYSESEKEHTCWGDVCTFIEYECKTDENSLFIDVVKETFR